MHDQSPLGRFATGDLSEDAFEAAVPELARLIRGYLIWYGATRESAEDLAQDALVKVYIYRSRRKGSGVVSLKGWLRVLCRNLVTDTNRERRSVLPLEDHCEPFVALDDLWGTLTRCIDGLREPDRTVFRLRYDSDWTTAHIAELFGWKARNCELILTRARRTLQRSLKRAGYACRVGERRA